MKKRLLGLSVILLLLTPFLAFSAESLTSKLQGKILLAVEDKGKTYYVHSDGNRYQITTATAQKIFEKLALGITNANLNQIPLKDVGISPEATITTCPTNTITTGTNVCPSCATCDYSQYNA